MSKAQVSVYVSRHSGDALLAPMSSLPRGAIALPEQGPIATGLCGLAKSTTTIFQQRPPRRMGPCFRRDDVGRERAFAISRHVLPELFIFVRASSTEGAGNAGCALHPRSRVPYAQA